MSIRSQDIPRHLWDRAALANPEFKLDGFTVTLQLPHKSLSPNSRCHWATKARAAKGYRSAAWAVALERLGRDPAPQWVQAVCQCRFYFPDRRIRDCDNLLASLKSAFDGLADAGIIANDSGLIHLPVVRDVDAHNPHVDIVVQAWAAQGE